jgi:hypothetical protein
VIAPWIEWEDWQAGLYSAGTDPDRVADSARLLRDPGAFKEAAREMFREWPTAPRQTLKHMWSGRNAWVGQAACCYAHGATAADTRAAWGTLNNTDQVVANAVARQVRIEWEKEAIDNAQAVLDY